jgi:hypothetical protein
MQTSFLVLKNALSQAKLLFQIAAPPPRGVFNIGHTTVLLSLYAWSFPDAWLALRSNLKTLS